MTSNFTNHYRQLLPIYAEWRGPSLRLYRSCDHASIRPFSTSIPFSDLNKNFLIFIYKILDNTTKFLQL